MAGTTPPHLLSWSRVMIISVTRVCRGATWRLQRLPPSRRKDHPGEWIEQGVWRGGAVSLGAWAARARRAPFLRHSAAYAKKVTSQADEFDLGGATGRRHWRR